MARIWVRVQDLPWAYLNTEWAVRILSHVGLVEAVDSDHQGLPNQSFLHARLVVDLTKPLIPGCFLPLDGDRVAWVYFRYEDIYKFCKECGCVGHNTGRCPLSAYEAQKIILRRVKDFEDSGMIILQSEEEESMNAASPTLQRSPQLGLGFPCIVSGFSGKRLRDAVMDRGKSVDSWFVFAGDPQQVKKKKWLKKYKEWDVKGGFIVRSISPLPDYSKALTDISMAEAMGVQPVFLSGTPAHKKRSATTSPLDPTGDWSLKRTKTSRSSSPGNDNDNDNNATIVETLVMDSTVKVLASPPPPRLLITGM